MKISALRLSNVKRFAGRSVAIEGISDGVNVLTAANEFGKSTSFEALHALFFIPYGSKGKDATALRPYSGGAPVVEADVETSEGRFRLTKQFLSGASAQVLDLNSNRLIAQADEAENFLAQLVRGGAGGPAAMLWVRQGLTGLEKRSKSDEESDREVRETLLQSVQGEVEAVTGGRRMAEILRGVSEELHALVTATGRAKAGGLYAAALAQRDGLKAEEARLQQEVEQLREALDERARVQAHLKELSDPAEAEARAQSLVAAEAALSAAKAQAQRLQNAETQCALARAQHDQAEQQLQKFDHARSQLSALEQELLQLEAKREEARTRRADLQSAIEKAQASAETAEQAERQASALLARIDAQKKAQEAKSHLADLEKALGNVEAALKAQEEHEALFKQLNISEKSIADLSDLEVEIATQKAIRKAARPSVVAHFAAGGAGKIQLDGDVLQDGEAHDYAGRADLLIEGIGRVSLQSPWDDDGRALEAVDAKRRQLLATLGVADLAAARAQKAKADQHEALAKEQKMQITLWAPDGAAALREKIAASKLLVEAASADDVPSDAAETQKAYEAARAQQHEANATLRSLNASLARADEELQAGAGRLGELQARAEQYREICGPKDAQQTRRQSLEDALTPLTQALEKAEQQVAELRAEAVDLEGAEASYLRIQSMQRSVETSIQHDRERLAELNGKIRERAGEAVEEYWLETKEALEGAQNRVEAFEREIAILTRLVSTLEKARSDARDLYLKPVMEELQPLLRLLFDDVAVGFDERSLQPESLIRGGVAEEVERLSGGMREQLSVLTRLAFARLLAKDGRPAPVILDDALVYSDDDRIEKMFDALHRQARDQQIIVFSCRQRAFQKLGGNALQLTEWHR